MTEPKRRKMLLATDLSSRSDRALDRAVSLAEQLDMELLVVHALQPDQFSALDPRAQDLPSWRRPPDPLSVAKTRIRQDLRGAQVNPSILVEEGDPVKVILEVVEREQCTLVVLGTARDEALGRMILGNTVDHLVRRSPVSVLIVRSRPNGPYRHLLVGTDFTEESRHGLQVAVREFPDAVFAVMHSYDPPYRGLSDTSLSHEFSEMEAKTMRRFLSETELPEEARARVQSIIEQGPPELMFRRYVEEKGADLTVIGAYGRGLLFHLMIGGNAPRIVDATPSDVLVVRAPRLGKA